ncbi:hypothetical protein WKI65_44190 [Streptomyces sp. MS1.AVA.3]|uniref:hypothetical protein n=1 Tax=Streptomyces decoyicus TaxID=249567 RepID=UPI0030BB93A5
MNSPESTSGNLTQQNLYSLALTAVELHQLAMDHGLEDRVNELLSPLQKQLLTDATREFVEELGDDEV